MEWEHKLFCLLSSDDPPPNQVSLWKWFLGWCFGGLWWLWCRHGWTGDANVRGDNGSISWSKVSAHHLWCREMVRKLCGTFKGAQSYWYYFVKGIFHSLPRNCSQMQSWGCNFANLSPEDKDTCLKSYHRHIQRVQDVIPPERLLVYNWSDGWSALSHFLGTRIPEEQFPHEDLVKRNAESHIEQRLKAWLCLCDLLIWCLGGKTCWAAELPACRCLWRETRFWAQGLWFWQLISSWNWVQRRSAP